MSRNKKLREKLAGHARALREHQEKLEAELGAPAPDMARVEGWRQTIRNIERIIARLEQRRRR